MWGRFRKRGGGKNSSAYIAVLPRALADARLPPKTTFYAVCSKLLMLNLNMRIAGSSKGLRHPIQSPGTGLPNSSFSRSARSLLTSPHWKTNRGPKEGKEREERS